MKTQQETIIEHGEKIEGIPICGSNFATPITDKSRFVTEVHYRIGDRLFVENAD